MISWKESNQGSNHTSSWRTPKTSSPREHGHGHGLCVSALVKLDEVALLVADPPNASSITNTDTHLMSDKGDTCSTLSTWLYRHISENTDTHLLGDIGDTFLGRGTLTH